MMLMMLPMSSVCMKHSKFWVFQPRLITGGADPPFGSFISLSFSCKMKIILFSPIEESLSFYPNRYSPTLNPGENKMSFNSPSDGGFQPNREELLQMGIRAAKAGNKDGARMAFEQI